jgi:hypothetical protein
MKINRYLRKNLPFFILIFVIIFHAILLLPELTTLSPDLNDNVFHYSLCVSMQEELETGGNLIDHWVPYWSIGYPVFHHYQHIPHLIVVLIFNIFYKQIPLFVIFRLFNYLLLVLYPLVLYYSLRKMRFSQLSSAGAALFSLALSNINGYGFELGAFAWRGSGMFAQLWAMFLLPLTLSSIYTTLKENKNYFQSVIFLFLLANSQVMFGLIAVLTASLFIFINLGFDQIWSRIKRLSLILVVFFIMISYLLIPMIVDSPYHAHSTYDFPEKWDSYGWRYITTQFLNGNIFDYGRLPVATILAVIGLLFSISRRSFKYRWVAAGFILWFLLYFGRPVWGFIIDLIPLSSALHLHRFVTMVHFFGAICAGIGLTVVFQLVKKKFRLLAAVMVILILAAPVFWERYQYLQTNSKWINTNKVAYQKEKKDFNAMLNFIRRSPPGRVYPGRRANWGKDFKIGQTAVFYLLGPNGIPALCYLPFSWALTGDFSVNFNEWNSGQYNLFNVKYFLADNKKRVPSFARLKKQAGHFRLYEIGTSGYFDLVESPMAIYADKNSIWNLMVMWMRSSWVGKKQFISIFFDRKYHPGHPVSLLLKDRWKYWVLDPSAKKNERLDVLSQEPLNIFSAKTFFEKLPYKTAAPGKVLSEKTGKNVFSGKVRANKDCFLLFKMTYHPGWHAYLDGKEVETVIMSPGLTGIRMKKGVHEVRFVYRAQRWKTFLILLGIAAAGGLFWWERKRK